jgi:hypothetical protein
MTIAVESEGADPPVTTLTGTVDQAALHGLLKKVRNLGMFTGSAARWSIKPLCTGT